jgi:competence protein ComEC
VLLSAASLAFAPACGAQPAPAAPTASDGFRVVFIDVGQGDAELITVGGHHMLIDGGRDGPTIVQRLNTLGVHRLDAVVATHPDADHTGGLTAVLEAFDVDNVYVNGARDTTGAYAGFLAAAAAEPGALIHTLHAGQSVALGSLALPVLSPAGASDDTNNGSIVLRLACGAVSVLFTGDAEAPAEQAMLDAGLVTRTTVLKAGHHGANTSTSSAFLRALQPEVAVVSAGRENAFGHPSPTTVARLAAAGALLAYTDTTPGDDSVTMTTDCATYALSPRPTSATPAMATPRAVATVEGPNDASPPPGFGLPACSRPGANSCDCSDFATHAHAQWFHDTHDPTDINKLDGPDHDGAVCEGLP